MHLWEDVDYLRINIFGLVFFKKSLSFAWRIRCHRNPVEQRAQNATITAVYAQAPKITPEVSPVRIEDSEFGELTICILVRFPFDH